MATNSPPIELDAQYRVLTEGAGVVPRGERGVLEAMGPDAAEYLQGQLTQDVEALAPGQGAYAALLDRKGHLVADARALRVEHGFILDTEPAALEPLRKHLATYKIGREVELIVPDPPTALISVIGPAAGEVVPGAPAGPEGAHTRIAIAGVEAVAVRADAGVDLLVEAPSADTVVDSLGKAGAELATEQAAEVLRVEAGRPRFGFELGPELMPAEGDIVERAVSFTKGCYIGQEPVARLHYRGKPNRRLRGLVLSEPARPGDELHLGEKVVGKIGTAALSPALGPIGLAVIRREAEPGSTVAVGGPDGPSGEVRELPLRGSAG